MCRCKRNHLIKLNDKWNKPPNLRTLTEAISTIEKGKNTVFFLEKKKN